MHRTIFISLAAAAVSMTAWCGSALAQRGGVEIYVGPSAYSDDYYYDDYRSGPRVYGYTRRAYRPVEADVEFGRPSGPGGCGQFRYWDGSRCADARDRRP